MHRQIAGKLTGPVTKWIVLVAVLVIAGGLASFAGKLTDVQNNETESWLPSSAESTKAYEKLSSFQDEYDVGTTVVYYKKAGLSASDLAAIEEQASRIEAIKGVSKVLTPERAKAAGVPAPFVSDDGQVAKMEFTLNYGDKLWEELPDLKPEVDKIIKIDGVESYLAGSGGQSADASTVFSSGDSNLMMITLLVVIVILLLSYRSAILWLLPIISAVFSAGASMGLLYFLAKNTSLTVNGQTQFILTVLVIGAGTDYALLLVARYREELRRHEDRHEAMAFALHRAAPALLASAATVVVGLLCLLFADLNSTAGLGPANAIGIAVTFVIMVTLLPALLVICGRWVFGPSRDGHKQWALTAAGMLVGGIVVSGAGGAVGGGLGGLMMGLGGLSAVLGLLMLVQVAIEHWTKVHTRPEFGSVEPTSTGLWARVGNAIAPRPRAVWAVTGVVLAALCLGFLLIDTSGIPSDEQYTKKMDSVTGQSVLVEHGLLDASTPVQVLANQDKADEVVDAMSGIDGIAAPAVQNGPDGKPFVVEGSVLINAELKSDPYSDQALDAVKDVRSAVHDVDGADALTAGMSAVTLDIMDASSHDNKLIMPIVLVAVLLILMGLLRAVLAPLLLIATVILSFGAALGISGLVFDLVYGHEHADPGFPLWAFVFLVALGIDYNIFLMSRVREETINHGTRKGSLIALSSTGGVITSAGVVLAATFATLATMPMTFTLQLGTTIALGVLLDTMVVRSVLVTALNLDLGGKIWWPSKLDRGQAPGDPEPDVDTRREPELV